ncbi:MAG: gliding motility-associated protein GldC [Saprospiraceae bacterium]|jgi:gliding motility-associated protein GldC
MQKEIKFTVTLDENNVPEKIRWNSSENEEDGEDIKSLLISVWDKNEKLTKRIDLWTKEMYVEEMKMMYFQTLMTMADGLERATGENEVAAEMRVFGKKMAEKMDIKT